MTLRKFFPLIIISCLLVCFFYFRLYHFLNFETLRTYHHLLLHWKEENYPLAVCIYISAYCLAVTVAFPGVLFFSIAGGYLFGPLLGTLYVLLGAGLGSVLLYTSVKLALADWFEKKVEKWLKPLEQGLNENAFYYLLCLRIIPIFPFFVINIAAGLLNLPLSAFLGATVLGIIPATLIYTSLGRNLNTLFELHQTPDWDILFKPSFLLPLLALGLLASLPIFYKYIIKRVK